MVSWPPRGRIDSEELKDARRRREYRALGALRLALDRALGRARWDHDDTEVMAHLAFFGVVSGGRPAERAPTEEECREYCAVVLAPLPAVTFGATCALIHVNQGCRHTGLEAAGGNYKCFEIVTSINLFRLPFVGPLRAL